MRPEIEGAQPTRDSPVFIQCDGNGSLEKWSRGVVSGDLKLIVDGFKDEVFFELYNLSDDPKETDNLAFKSPRDVLDCLEPLRKHMERTGDLVSVSRTDYESFLKIYAYQKPEQDAIV